MAQDESFVWFEVGGSWQKYAKSVDEAQKKGITNDILYCSGDVKIFKPSEILVCSGDGEKISVAVLLENSVLLNAIRAILQPEE